MALHYRADAIVLSKENRGEADQLIFFLTQHLGIVRVHAVSSRKLTSKLRGGVGLFSSTAIEFVQGRGRKTLIEARTFEARGAVLWDLLKLRVGLRVTETVLALCHDQDPDMGMYALIQETLDAIGKASREHASLLYYAFFWKLIDILGYGPNNETIYPEIRHMVQYMRVCSMENVGSFPVSQRERALLNLACKRSFLSIPRY